MPNKFFKTQDSTVSFLLSNGEYSKPIPFENFTYTEMFDDEWLSMEIHEYYEDEELADCEDFWNQVVLPLYEILKNHKEERKAAGW